MRFHGGIHPDYHKGATSGKKVEPLPPPELLYVPVSQHIGAPAEPLVAPGDKVALGQLIAKSEAQLTARIHAPVSGTVREIAPHPHPSGRRVQTIVIENDGLDTVSDEVRPCPKRPENLTFDELVALARDAGIVGMGGAGFPAHIKLASARGKIDTLLINGAECEPYLTADHRLMLEAPESILFGADLLRRCFEMERVQICVEDNKPDAVAALQAHLADFPGAEVITLPSKYPQGSEKHIIKAVTGREVPSGALPADARCAVFNVDTCASLTRAFRKGLPVHKRIVTVSGGAVAQPKNLLCRIGTPFSELVAFCGGEQGPVGKVLMGGPMMGACQFDLAAPVIKTTSGLLLLSEEKPRPETHCIRCGRCVRACPMGLAPLHLKRSLDCGELDGAVRLGLRDCIECGCCAYVCPASLDLVARFRVGKQQAVRQQKEREAAASAEK